MVGTPERERGVARHRARRPFGRALWWLLVFGVGISLWFAWRAADPPVDVAVPPGANPVSTTGRGPEPPTDQVWVGAWITPAVFSQAGRVAAVEDFERRIGRRLDLVNSFHDWDDAFPTPADIAVVEQGRELMVSWSGTDTRVISSGAYDQQIREQARAVRNLGAPILIRWRWEMDRPNLQASVWSPEDYIAAWTRIRGIFTEEGATNAGWVWCPLANGFPDGRAQPYYPGDDQVDWLCADVYPNEDGSSFAEEVVPFLEWAADHPRPIVIGEFGDEYDPEDPSFQGQWIDGATEVAKTSTQIRAMVYFEGRRGADNAAGKRPFDYTLAEGTAGLDAFRRLASELADRPFSGR